MPSRQSPRKPWQRTQKGQVLLIFALTAVVVFAIMGLAIDAGISYLHSDQQAKAAAAAALSGVAYLPGDYTSAQREALLTAQRNGYTTNSLSGTSAVTVAVSQPANTTNELKVAITAPAPVYFLDLFGFGKHLVTSSALAEYLPPIQLGQPGNSLGTTEDQVGKTGYYFLRTEGYGNPRSEGDAFTPTPTDSNSACGGSCTASPPDVHQISCIAGNDSCTGTYPGMRVNDTGGYDYLIYVPPGGTADVKVDSPSFQPGVDSGSLTNSYHDDDSSFPALSSGTEPPATDYASMGFTLYAVPDINNRANDIPLKQDIFCPFNAYGLEAGSKTTYTYYAGCNTPGSSVPAGVTPVTGTPAVFQSPTGSANLVSILSYAPTGADATLFDPSYNNLASEPGYVTAVGGVKYLYGGPSSGPGQYFRLRVDTLAWNGSPINTSSSGPTPTKDSNTLPDGYPLAHDAYALQVVTPTGGTGTCTAACTVSAMADMCIYTPINGSSFQVPLFNLPSEYAGKTLAVRVFDPGDVNGTAYLGIVQPGYTATPPTGPPTTYPTGYATLATNSDGKPSADNVGTSLAAYEAGSVSGSDITPSDGSSPTYTFRAGTSGVGASAVVQTGSGGSSLFNGQWVQFDIKVPSDYTPSAGIGAYWYLYYDVAAGTTAGDTITVQVQYLGSPVHLLP
jgi:hypothetical protein